MLVLDATVVNVALPHIQTDLGFTAAGLSWVLNAYTLAFGGLLLLGGRLGDVFGRLRTFEVGLAIFTVASLLGGLATTPAWLIAARTLQGVGAALAAPSVLALVTTSARNDAARNRGLALFTAVSSAGASIGLLLGGALTGFVSWHWTLFVNVPIGAVVLVLAVASSPRHPACGCASTSSAQSRRRSARSLGRPRLHQRRRPRLELRRSPSPRSSRVCCCSRSSCARRAASPRHCCRSASSGIARGPGARAHGSRRRRAVLDVLPRHAYLQLVLGFSPVATGAAFLPLSLAIFATSRVSARLVAAVGPRPLLLVGTLGLTASFVWLSSITTSSTYAVHLLGALVLNGVSAALVFMPVTVIVLGGVDRTGRYGLGSAPVASSSAAPSAWPRSSACMRHRRFRVSSCLASSWPSSPRPSPRGTARRSRRAAARRREAPPEGR